MAIGQNAFNLSLARLSRGAAALLLTGQVLVGSDPIPTPADSGERVQTDPAPVPNEVRELHAELVAACQKLEGTALLTLIPALHHGYLELCELVRQMQVIYPALDDCEES